MTKKKANLEPRRQESNNSFRLLINSGILCCCKGSGNTLFVDVAYVPSQTDEVVLHKLCNINGSSFICGNEFYVVNIGYNSLFSRERDIFENFANIFNN